MNCTFSAGQLVTPKIGEIFFDPVTAVLMQFDGVGWVATVMPTHLRWALFLDDTREPRAVSFSTSAIVRVARSSEEAKTLIERLGLPAEISFDHDLGGDDTGFSFLWWLVNGHQDEKWDLRQVLHAQVHSANTVGADKIVSLWENFAKHVGIETKISRARAYED